MGSVCKFGLGAVPSSSEGVDTGIAACVGLSVKEGDG